jgi:hypothetical protein
MPPWLRRQLEAAGRLDTDGVGRAASGASCRGCGAQVLQGLDDDTCALPAAVDPQPISVLGEAAAVLAGRDTYDLWGRARVELDYRDAVRIAWPRAWPVLAAHTCGAPPLPADPTVPRHARRPAVSDTPPF